MDTSFIHGIIPPIITPLDKDENVDEAKMRKQVDFVINGGVHGILAFGSNSEFYVFEEDENFDSYVTVYTAEADYDGEIAPVDIFNSEDVQAILSSIVYGK